MVAITVILAAVIAAFVFGLAGTTGSSKNVGITVAKSGTEDFSITIQGGTDLSSLTQLSYSANGTTYDNVGSEPYETGEVFTVPAWVNSTTPDNSGVRFIVRGEFNDGSQQVLFDRQY